MQTDAKAEIDEIYLRSYQEIFSFCLYRLFHRDMAADVVAEVFLRLVEEYPRLRSRSAAEIRNWLYGTARNFIARSIRDSKRRLNVFRAKAREADCTNESTGNSLDWPIMFAAISKLKPMFQDIIVLRFCQGMKTADIADILNVNHNTLRVRLTRAIAMLKEELKEPFGGID